MNIIDPSFYKRDTIEVAQDLLGKTLIRYYNGLYLTGIITETEAYRCSDDPASHAYRGKTERNAAMFGPVGYAYIYFIYGVHFCLNVVARSQELQAGAVLIRSIMPTQGISFMQEVRKKVTNLTNGPGKLAQALCITRKQNGIDMTQQGELFIIDTGFVVNEENYISTPRIGLSVAQDSLWRFYITHVTR